ncbi:sensor histidine kinase [Bacteroides sp.]
MIQYITSIILCLGIYSSSYAVNTHIKDSLLQQLNHTTEPAQRIRIYRNLADVCFESVDEKTYLLKMYDGASKVGDRKSMLDALTDITFAAEKEYQMDSAYHYINLIKQVGNPEEVAELSSYFHMRFFDTLCSSGETAEAINKELIFLEDNNQSKNIYEQIAKAYIIGSSLFSNDMMKEALPYLKTAALLLKELPMEHRSRFQTTVNWRLASIYSWVGKSDSAVYVLEKSLQDQLLDYDMHYKNQRPFYNIAVRKLQVYAMLLTNVITKHPEKADEYWQKIAALGKECTINPIDRYNYYLSMNNYYLNRKPKPDYEKALMANDSLIKYAVTIAPSNLSGLYDIKSQTYEVMGKYKEALNSLRTSFHYKDSLANDDMLKKLSELQVKYDLNKLNNEKSQLEIRNKRILVICLSAILIIVIVVCFILFHNLKKEKAMKIRLHILNQKAMESEKMKTAFINSICHEIRTPLNAIVGFSDLIFNKDIDEEIREEFPKEIQNNTTILISLINNMLEVSSLDVSEDKLPCAPTDINHICCHEMDTLIRCRKKDIDYQLELPQESIIIPTHEKYLSLVVEHLLNNANKFTEKGSITLSCQLDVEQHQLSIIVSDTGCGIPRDKYKEVFERFSKLNSFSQGNGLGLYLCQLIIKRLSGDIHIDPAYTEGTRIVVTLPIS